MKNNTSIFEAKGKSLLDKICKEEKIDKGKQKHYYTRWFNYFFSDIRNDDLNILEIGVADGRSLKMWKNYFVNSNIYGIEKNPVVINKKLVAGCKIFIGDQSDINFLKKVCKKAIEGFDIIIDDGSHITAHQVKTFKYMFKKMNTGGIYVIEDLQTSYMVKYRRGPHYSTVDFLKNKVDDVNFHGKYRSNNIYRLIRKKYKLNKYEKMIDGIAFFAGICFIFKRSLK